MHVSKFVIHVTKFVTKTILYERKNYLADSKNYLADNENYLADNENYPLRFLFFRPCKSRLVSDGYLIHTNYGRTQITKNLPRLTGFKCGRF